MREWLQHERLEKKRWRQSNPNMKKFQNGRGVGQLGEVFHVSRMREKHRENRQMRKTGWELVVVSSHTDGAFTVHFTVETASRHSHLSFSQMCLSLLITVVSVFGHDLIGFIYMIIKPPLLSVNDASLCFPIRFHQACVVHRLSLNIFRCFCLLTCHCWLGFVMKAFWIIQRNDSISSYTPAEMKNLFVHRAEEECSYLCTVLTPFILNVFSLFPLDSSFRL